MLAMSATSIPLVSTVSVHFLSRMSPMPAHFLLLCQCYHEVALLSHLVSVVSGYKNDAKNRIKLIITNSKNSNYNTYSK